ncbi:F-actin-capping protein [Salix suchowensis]|nr:F-actin-capping protein [Salix suchowensis]
MPHTTRSTVGMAFSSVVLDVSHHRLGTVRRVRKTALALANSVTSASTTKPDLLVVELDGRTAALLHDVLDKKYVSPEQASDPYAYFLPFFQSTLAVQDELDLIADGRARLITRIIDNISWKTEQALREKGLVTDCTGNAWNFIVSRMQIGWTPSGHLCFARASRGPANATSAIQHFYEKLLHISEQLKTEPGKRMGRKRHQMVRR